MFFSPGSFWINVFFCKFVSIQDYLYNGILVSPEKEIFSQPWIFLSCTSHNGKTVIFFPASCPGPGRAFGDADTAAHTFFCVPDNLIIFHMEGVYRKLVAAFDTGAAAYTAAGIVLRFGHADNAEIMHPGLDTVVGAAGKSDLKMQVIGENGFFDPFCKGRCIIVSERTDPVADAGADISGSGRGVAGAGNFLIDLQIFNNGLKFFINLCHVPDRDPFNLESLAGSNMYLAVAVFSCNFCHLSQYVCVTGSSGNTDSGGHDISVFGHTKSVLF